ncbi:MAG TPA: NAD(P)-dependent oxidoreductase [Polyangium sp.]|nr:NAD(P)-dependent oxidoreductase [Polyangium sp.]
MTRRILMTGSSGLVGSALGPALVAQGFDVAGIDIQAIGVAYGDVRDRERMGKALAGVHGIIHLAAVSRVIWGERDPELCWSTNVGGLRSILELAAMSPLRPWVIFASSREVYGQPDCLPVAETCPVRPVNVYGRSKVEGEKLVAAARRDGLRACTIRLSNVFGSTYDHFDRVVPAFARGAALGQTLRIDGAEHTFDFTHVDDVTRGITALTEYLASGKTAPEPIHFVSGVPTTLGQLAEMAIRIAGTDSTIRHAPPRDFDVAKFHGTFARAKEVLDWEPRVSLEKGLTRLIHDFRALGNAALAQEVAQ